MAKTDIGGSLDEKYRRFSVKNLGEYQAPR